MTDNKNNSQAVTEALFYNPFSTKTFLSVLTGLSYYKVTSVLENTRGVICQTVTTGIPRYYQRVFSLDEKAQIKAVGTVQSPSDMCAALGMTYSRLEKFRSSVFKSLAERHTILWTISPWKVSSDGLFLDALLCVQTSDELVYLMGVVLASEAPDTRWYERIVDACREWRRFNQTTIPFKLLFWNAPDFHLVREIISSVDIGVNGIIEVEAHGKIHSFRRGWQDSIKPISAILLNPIDLVASKRSCVHPGYKLSMTASGWCRQFDQPVGFAAGIREKMKMPHLLILLSAAKRPGLKPNQHKQFVDPKKTRHDIPQLIKQLIRWKALEITPGIKRIYLTELGLRTLSLIYGTPIAELNRYFGISTRRDQAPLRYHHVLASDIMSSWQNAGLVASWRSSCPSYSFKIPEAIARDAEENNCIQIVPDISGAMRVGKLYTLFWMEIDRGTKGLEDTFRQVQKYVLAGMTVRLRRPPLTLWVIADSRGNHLQRVQQIVEETEKAFSRHPGSRTVLAITDVESVNGTKFDEIINKEIWRLISSSNPVRHAVSLASIFEE